MVSDIVPNHPCFTIDPLLANLSHMSGSMHFDTIVYVCMMQPLHFLELPNAPNGLEVVIKANDTTPVTAVISWMALMDSATGIPPRGNQTSRYFVEVSNSSSAVLFSATVEHPTNMVEAPNLPPCENLTMSVTAENLFFDGISASEDFMTVEPGW